MDLFEHCMAGKHRSRYTITGSTVLKFCISPFIVWCDIFAPPEERDPENPYLHLLFERGMKHEEDVLKARYENAVEISLTSFEDGFKQVLNECKSGAEVIAHAPLFYLPEDVYGIADVLVRSDAHKSVFGDYHYVVREIKSAKHMKNEYIMQAAFYNYILGKIQGFTPRKFYLINRENEEFEFQYEDYEEQVMLAIQGIREVFDGKDVSPTAKAVRWPWTNYANKQAIEANDVSILPSVGPALKKRLNKAGIKTVDDLASKPIAVDITDKAKKKLKVYAKAWVDGKAIPLKAPKLPESEVELYLDFEGTDDMQTEEGITKTTYLIGVLIREPAGTHFRAFVAERLTDEGRMFHDFLAFMKKYAGAPVYHYGNYERMHMKVLGEKYGIDVSHITKEMVDLLSVLRKSVALPTLGMSLKKVGEFLNFEWRGMADAQESIVLYLQFLETGERELMRRIVDYNEDDVRATLKVKEFLAGLGNK